MDGKEWLRYHDLSGLYCECVKNLPEEFKTHEVYVYAVRENGYALEFIPDEFKTAELCMEAVKSRSFALKFVPEELKTADLCFEAVKESCVWGFGSVYECVPEALRTADLWLKVVSANYRMLEYVPIAIRDEIIRRTNQPPKRARRARWIEWKSIVYSKVKMILKRCKN